MREWLNYEMSRSNSIVANILFFINIGGKGEWKSRARLL